MVISFPHSTQTKIYYSYEKFTIPMKNLFLDITALVGFGAVMAGCYLNYGLPNTLMIGGSVLVVYALVAAMRGKRAS